MIFSDGTDVTTIVLFRLKLSASSGMSVCAQDLSVTARVSRNVFVWLSAYMQVASSERSDGLHVAADRDRKGRAVLAYNTQDNIMMFTEPFPSGHMHF